MTTANFAQNTATALIRDIKTGEERRIPLSACVLAAPDDLAPGEPVRVKLDLSAPEFPAADIEYLSTAGALETREQVAVSYLKEESVLPRSEWLVAETTPGREEFYYRAVVKVDVIDAAGAEVETETHRYSAVCRGDEFTLRVARFDSAGQAVDPVRYTGKARIDRDALVLDIGEQAAAVPADVLGRLHEQLEKRLGLQPDGEAEQAQA